MLVMIEDTQLLKPFLEAFKAICVIDMLISKIHKATSLYKDVSMRKAILRPTRQVENRYEEEAKDMLI